MDLPALHAHRLGRAYGPDSSHRALRASLAQPIDGLETDVCLTADEKLVLLHDPLLELNTTLSGWAHEVDAAAIASASLRDSRGRPTSEFPLLLDELLEAVPPELTIQLEVKAHSDPALARRTAEVLCERYREHPSRRRIEVLSFLSAACAVAAAAGFRSRLIIWADYTPEALATWAVSHGVAGVSVEHFLLSEHLLRVLRLAGLSVTTGTVNHAEILARVARLGVDAVTTDRPHELRREALELGFARPEEPALPLAASAGPHSLQ